MALLGLYMAVLTQLFFTGRVEAGFGLQSFNPAEVNLIPLKAYFCENSEPMIEVTTNLRNINDKGDKVMDVSFELEEEVNENWRITVIVDIWNNGAWDEDFFRIEGTFCKLLLKFAEKPWENFRRDVKPTIREKCLVEVGKYAISNYTVKLDDVVAPIAVLGKYKLTATFFNPVGVEIVCQVVEAEVTPP